MQFAGSNASFMQKLSHSDTAGSLVETHQEQIKRCFPWLFQTVATNSPFVDAAGKRNQENQVGWNVERCWMFPSLPWSTLKWFVSRMLVRIK